MENFMRLLEYLSSALYSGQSSKTMDKIPKMAALPDKKDERDYCFEALGTSMVTQKEWEDGYDIEKVMGQKLLPVKNQGSSLSCVGQSFAYYVQVLNKLRGNNYREVSAKSIYSLIALGINRGAYLRDGAKSVKNLGALWEDFLSSFDNSGYPTQAHLYDKSWFNEDTKNLMKELKASEYYTVTNKTMDGYAKAIRDGNGMVAGMVGINNGTWNNFEPTPPNLSDTNRWYHATYFGRFGIDEQGKYIDFINSWGDWNDGNRGWQRMRENYFINNGSLLFNPWILIYNKNMKKETSKILKDKNSSAVGVWLPAISEDVLKSYALNMGRELPMKDGNIDWEKAIEGEFELK